MVSKEIKEMTFHDEIFFVNCTTIITFNGVLLKP
jgi:hypothetical protein